MKRHISGNELRDRLLSRMEVQDREPTEETRIEALSSVGNRALLEIIATKQPRSISELATYAGRLQPNVSRSLSALARSGLLTMTVDGRASIPTLTQEGHRRAEALGFVPLAHVAEELSPSVKSEASVLSATILGSVNDELKTDEVQARVAMRFSTREEKIPLTTQLDLNELCMSLLMHLWRILYRRGDPFKMFSIERETSEGTSRAIVLAESTGRIDVFIRSIGDEQDGWNFPRLSLSADDFLRIVLDELALPLVSRLRAGRRFDRPSESLLRRTEEILHNPADLTFWRSAGSFGLSYQSMNDNAAARVASLVSAILDEDARLEFASATSWVQLDQVLSWIEQEIEAKAHRNSLPRLIELRQGKSIMFANAKPWRVGTNRAREARKQIGLAEDRSVGGLSGLARIFSGDGEFVPSSAGEDLLRGFQGRGDDVPVVVVRDEGPKSTSFLVSRAIGDYLVYGNREAPIVNIYSDRQAVGRAFAEAFMAPARGVVQMIDEEGQSLDAVAEHYGVVREVVRHQYENNVAQYARAV